MVMIKAYGVVTMLIFIVLMVTSMNVNCDSKTVNQRLGSLVLAMIFLAMGGWAAAVSVVAGNL